MSLHQVEPREQVGAQTGRRYEYQYELAALESLRLLTENDCVCVYCEWHDDFVVEKSDTTLTYEFHQVKTRNLSQGPWTLGNVFGLGRRPAMKKASGTRTAKGKKTVATGKGKATGATGPTPASEGSIANRLLEHRASFDGACQGLCFVTNHAIHPDFSKFLDEVQAAENLPDDLGENARREFDWIVAAYAPLEVDEAGIVGFLRCFRVLDEKPNWRTSTETHHAIAERVFVMSEVDLTHQQATQIGKELVDLVRIRSHLKLKQLPASLAALRKAKGVCADDVLALLSLSPAGYRALQTDDPERVRSLSRLQRLCKASSVPNDLVPKICGMKSSWDTWSMAERENVGAMDLMSLRHQCGKLLTLHAARKMDVSQLGRACTDLADTFSHVPSVQPLTGELVLGHVFAIAAETGDWS